ncbi:MAG: hypothetical protein FWH50_01970, partial [Coriobacteriia bacterium]|nr:hypothetical protein [Coriobacteriia bacterium]
QDYPGAAGVGSEFAQGGGASGQPAVGDPFAQGVPADPYAQPGAGQPYQSNAGQPYSQAPGQSYSPAPGQSYGQQQDPYASGQPSYQYASAPLVPDQVGDSSKNGMAIASLVLSICTFIFCCTVVPPYITGILSIIFGIKSRKSGRPGIALSGLIIGIVSMVITVLYSIYFVWFLINDPEGALEQIYELNQPY